MGDDNIKLNFGAAMSDKKIMSRFSELFHKCLRELAAINVLNKGENGSVCFELIDDTAMQKINNDYRNIDKTTDVISLSYRDEMQFPGKENLLGEIFISLDTARKQASENGIELNDELDFLFVHGILHVFGFDHQTRTDKKEMFEVQHRLLG